MRKSTTATLALLITASFAGTLFAQGLTGKGVKVGINIAKFGGDDAEDLDSKIGLAIGGFITYSVNDRFAIQPEVFYTMKGAKSEVEDFVGETITSTLSFNYLEIPVLAKLTIPTEGAVEPNVFLGPALAINLSADSKTEFAGVELEVDLKEFTKSVDFGLVVGAGAAYAMGEADLTVDARYTLGLATIDDPEEGDAADVKNQVISVMVGYSF